MLIIFNFNLGFIWHAPENGLDLMLSYVALLSIHVLCNEVFTLLIKRDSN